ARSTCTNASSAWSSDEASSMDASCAPSGSTALSATATDASATSSCDRRHLNIAPYHSQPPIPTVAPIARSRTTIERTHPVFCCAFETMNDGQTDHGSALRKQIGQSAVGAAYRATTQPATPHGSLTG